MERTVAKIISHLFHPLLMPLAMLFIVFQLSTYIQYTVSFQAKNMIYTIVFLNTFLVPAFTTFYLFKKKIIESMEMHTRQERWFPYIMTACLYAITYYLMSQITLPPIIHSIMFGVTISVVVTLLVNLFTKISIHAIGIGGFVGGLFAVSQKLVLDISGLLITAIFIAGLVGFARLKLQAHSQWEYYGGSILGFLCLYMCVFFELG